MVVLPVGQDAEGGALLTYTDYIVMKVMFQV